MNWRVSVRRFTVSLGVILLVFSSAAWSDPIYPNSVVSNELEFIATSDQSVFACTHYRGSRRAEMPDKRSDTLMANGTHIFRALYRDATSVEIWVHAAIGSRQAAENIVLPVAEAVGKLPSFMREKLDRVVIHQGDETAFAESNGHFFVLYSDNIRTRIRNHDLEETVFHESVHATLDKRYARSRAWRAAQRADGAFITDYAENNPDKEDMAESALFAWAMLMHPGRLPADIEARVISIMPHRLAFFEELFLSKNYFWSDRPVRSC